MARGDSTLATARWGLSPLARSWSAFAVQIRHIVHKIATDLKAQCGSGCHQMKHSKLIVGQQHPWPAPVARRLQRVRPGCRNQSCVTAAVGIWRNQEDASHVGIASLLPLRSCEEHGGVSSQLLKSRLTIAIGIQRGLQTSNGDG